MKIKLAVFVDGEFIPSHSGASNRFHYLSRYLQMTGEIDVVVFVCDRGWCNYSDIIKEPFVTYLLKPEEYYNNINFVAGLLAKENVDIVQWGNIEGCIFQGIPLCKLINTHLMLEAHYDALDFTCSAGASDIELDYIKRMHSVFGKSLDGVIVLSNNDVETIKKNLSLTDDVITCIPSGVDVDELQPIPNPKTKKVVFLGNLYFQPNVHALNFIHEHVYPVLVDKGYTFLIGGDIPNVIKQKYEADDFHFLGNVDDLNTFFQDATIALCPIFDKTGMRIKILNYLAAGLPVITTSLGASGFPDKNILLIEDRMDIYPEIIDALVQDENRYWAISEKSRKYAETNLSWKVIAIQCVNVYKKILSKNPCDKNEFIRHLSAYGSYQPAWLEEVIKKGRFKDMNSLIKEGYFIKIENGNIKQCAIDLENGKQTN